MLRSAGSGDEARRMLGVKQLRPFVCRSSGIHCGVGGAEVIRLELAYVMRGFFFFGVVRSFSFRLGRPAALLAVACNPSIDMLGFSFALMRNYHAAACLPRRSARRAAASLLPASGGGSSRVAAAPGRQQAQHEWRGDKSAERRRRADHLSAKIRKSLMLSIIIVRCSARSNRKAAARK